MLAPAAASPPPPPKTYPASFLWMTAAAHDRNNSSPPPHSCPVKLEIHQLGDPSRESSGGAATKSQFLLIRRILPPFNSHRNNSTTMASTLTQTSSQQQKRQKTMTASSPTSEHKKRLGFFKRHLGRRHSGVPFLEGLEENGVSLPPAPPTKTSKPIIRRTSAAPGAEFDAQLATLNPANDIDDNYLRPTSDGSEVVEEALSRSPSKGSKGGVKWAAVEETGKLRPRRLSSAASRRSSIFARDANGRYPEGVAHGVGTKARRLSVQIPDSEFDIEDCRLEDHFNLLARAGKKVIGEGGAAVVQTMESKMAGAGKKLYAVKQFRPWDEGEETVYEYRRKIKSEYAIAKACQHPNIVETFCLCYSNNRTSWYHVMEYCETGDLTDILKANFFSREDRDCMFKQLLRGVEYLHSRGIAHRDLKSENLLLTNTGCLKIGDFGTSEVFSGTHPGARRCRRPSIVEDDDEIRLCKPGLVGSRPYMAPELLLHDEHYDPRGLDIWSCGIVYLTLIIGGTPWECATPDINNYHIYEQTWQQYCKVYPDGMIQDDRALPAFAQSKQFKQIENGSMTRLVFRMLHPDPKCRCSAKEALESKVVSEFACCQQDGYSDDIKTRQRKALHNHCPRKPVRGFGPLKA